MIKLNICACRIPGLTRAQYERYSKDNHARLVLGTEPVSRYIVKYIQQHVFDAAYGALAAPWRWDSVSQISGNSVEDLMAATSTQEYREVIALDEPRFADGRSAIFTMATEEEMVLPTKGASSYRLLHFGKAREEGGAAELQERWLSAHAGIAAEAPQVLRPVRRAVLNRAQQGPQGAPAFDAMGELGFVDKVDIPAMEEYVAMMEERLGALLDKDRSFFLLCEAVPVRGTLY